MDIVREVNQSADAGAVRGDEARIQQGGHRIMGASERKIAGVSLSERETPASHVPFPKFLRGGAILPSEPIYMCQGLARENFRNYCAGINYLVQKYGSQRVNEALGQLGLSASEFDRLELAPDVNEHGQERLAPRDPNRKRREVFTKRNLLDMEAKIIEAETGSGGKKSAALEIALAVGFTAVSAAQFVLTLDAGAAANVCQTVARSLDLVGTLCDDSAIIAERREAARVDETVPFPKILGEDEKIVFHTDGKKIAQENFKNFYRGISYLVAKYGLESVPEELMDELGSLCCEQKLPLLFVRVQNSTGQMKVQLSDQLPSGVREIPFTWKDLVKWENRITGKEGVEIAKTVARIVGASLVTAAAVTGTVVTFGAGAPAAVAATGTLTILIASLISGANTIKTEIKKR